MKREDKYSNKIDKFIIFSILAVLLIGLLTTIFFDKDINAYENRYANKINKLKLESYIDKSFQNSFESALSDQIQLSLTAKKIYNLMDLKTATAVLNTLRKNYDGYVYYKGNIIYKDMLLFAPYPYQSTVYWLNFKIENYNKLFANYPDLDFYVYYIEKDTDIDFTKNEEAGFYEYIKNGLSIDKNRISGFEVNSFDSFSKYFYVTDHHWNYLGSYKGYTQVLELINPDISPLEPLETVTSSNTFQGSKSIGFYNTLSDKMNVYKFNYPDMRIYINGLESEDYGSQDAFFDNLLKTPGYGAVYGEDVGEVVFATDNRNSNILIIGESYDNAIIKLIASHFNRTHCVDLRYYEHYMNMPFNFDEYIDVNDIEKVLFIGNIDFFSLKEFNIDTEGDE